MVILIDNGHGENTQGKRSPDGRLREYAWAREIAGRIVKTLTARGYDARLITPEATDVALGTRVARVNAICRQVGAKNALLISVHINAAGNGNSWRTASGWSGWVAPNASTASKRLASLLYDQAKARQLQGNRAVPAGQYWTGNFAIVRDTVCPAVLTENLFMDNATEVNYLLSEVGKAEITDLHVDAIINYINQAK
ncbi:MAG: N-acetylmuramoyl-L-alanine amidase [Bacteroides sp.]|nr:N-acetylmuramoyl-L-alanine amidase [Bacteroides sp.]MCM1413118.1 N-acetylmuramoyl-L-alanine amidase [Bacteroides sp.]MCM1472140.1 N-acetylmuramoyl-L-alanine amidase [Bacteroides sp.]